MKNDAFQDHYPDELAHCYGCGRLNGRGHQLKSYWDGDETVASFTPEPYHIAIPGRPQRIGRRGARWTPTHRTDL
jgi:hypothetical protein